MIFHWSLSDSKSPQVSRTLLSIVHYLNNAVVWLVSTHHLISKFFSPCHNPLVTVPITRETISITVASMFHRFYQFPSKIQLLIFLLAFFQLYSVFRQDSKVHNSCVLFFLTIIRSGCLAEFWWSIFSQNPRGICPSHSPRHIQVWAHTTCSYGQI